MADYHTPTVVQPSIPIKDFSSLELFILTRMFNHEQDDNDTIYLFSEEGPMTTISVDPTQLADHFVASEGHEGVLYNLIEELLPDLDYDQPYVDVDLSGTDWTYILQDVLKTLPYLTVIQSFTCSRMHPDGFGGMVILITPTNIRAKSTIDILHDFFKEEGIDA